MELIRKSWTTRVKNLVDKIFKDDLFLLSSSISYYSALAIAPFLLILLGVAALIGSDVQDKVVDMAVKFSPQVGDLVSILFNNVNQGVNFGSISGIIGIIILLSTASMVFLQMRYSLDVIYGYFSINASKTILQTIKERLFAMLVVFCAGVFFIVASSLPGIVRYLFGPKNFFFQFAAFGMNFIIFVAMFWLIHYVCPTRRPGKREAFKMAFLSSMFFIVGNILLASYLKGVASSSIYGAAGALLIFLIWTYYSAFTMFLSVEVFLFLKRIGKIN